MSTGYISQAVTKESGAPGVPIAANVWTPIDFGLGTLVTLPEGPCVINAQLYFEGRTAGGKMAVRVQRGTGDDTAQQDYAVLAGPWAVSYSDLEFVKVPDVRRGIEVWSDRPCVLYTHILKVENAAAYISARVSPTAGD